MKVVVAGGSGALGRRICADLSGRGHDAVVLTRTRPDARTAAGTAPSADTANAALAAPRRRSHPAI
jgi:nucleoside-diphosphate-sugar epimerase